MSFESISNSGESVSPKPLVQGVLDWNKWRLDNPTVDLDLSGTNLAAAILLLVLAPPDHSWMVRSSPPVLNPDAEEFGCSQRFESRERIRTPM
jgi:hypothetical protein